MDDLFFNIFPNEQYMDLTLYQYGWERCKPSHSFGPVIRNHYLFHYILNGKGVLYTTDSSGNTHTCSISKHQGFLISPRQVNTYIADENDPWEYAWIEFDGLRAKEYLDNAGLTIDHPIYRSDKKDPQFENELLTIVKNDNTASPLFQIGHLYLFLDLLIKTSFNSKDLSASKVKDFYIREAITFIEQNYMRAITIEDIAQFCNLNRSYLGKLFKETVHKTPQQFLIYYRMKQASELLRLSDMAINEVGKSVGYQNQLHFSRAFKNVYGQSPSQWRKNNQIFGSNSLKK